MMCCGVLFFFCFVVSLYLLWLLMYVFQDNHTQEVFELEKVEGWRWLQIWFPPACVNDDGDCLSKLNWISIQQGERPLFLWLRMVILWYSSINDDGDCLSKSNWIWIQQWERPSFLLALYGYIVVLLDQVDSISWSALIPSKLSRFIFW